MEKSVCCLCKKDEGILIFKKDKYSFLKCPCGIIYVNPRDTFTKLKDRYNKNEVSGIFDYLTTREDDVVNFRKRLKVIEMYSKKERPLKILDVGCNVGAFLEVVRDKNFIARGIDINKSAVEEVKKRGMNAKVGILEDEVANEKFDLIVMGDLIEHLVDPQTTLKKANNLLSNEGILFLSTPDAGSIMAKLTKKKWLHYKPKEHIYYFNRKTITKLLNRTGFSVLNIYPTGRIRSIGTIIHKISEYSPLISKLANSVTPKSLKNKSMTINNYDEIAIIAQKTN